jgi:hypothetical protein
MFQSSMQRQQQAAMEQQMAEYFAIESGRELFSNMSNLCMDKCVGANMTSVTELTAGETSCVERCVKKYVEALPIINDKLSQQIQGRQ